MILPCGVTVAHWPLTPAVMVRIHAGQFMDEKTQKVVESIKEDREKEAIIRWLTLPIDVRRKCLNEEKSYEKSIRQLAVRWELSHRTDIIDRLGLVWDSEISAFKQKTK